jgi:hypothetical protein
MFGFIQRIFRWALRSELEYFETELRKLQEKLEALNTLVAECEDNLSYITFKVENN